jgi:hypothetical protein
MSIYVIEEQGDQFSTELAPIAYRTFEQAKEYITARATDKGWEIVNDYDEPEPDFEEDNVNRYTAGRARPAERPVGKTYIWAQGESREIPIVIHKLSLGDDAEDPVGPEGGRRKGSSGARRKSLKQRLAAAKKKCSPGYEVYDYRMNRKGEFFNCLPAGLKRRKTRRTR